jgi:hypothetical protein
VSSASDEAVTLLRRGIPAWLERRLVVIAPGATLGAAAMDWSGALVVLEHGSVVLEAVGGERLALAEGAVFCVAEREVVAIHNDGRTSAVLAVGKRASH